MMFLQLLLLSHYNILTISGHSSRPNLPFADYALERLDDTRSPKSNTDFGDLGLMAKMEAMAAKMERMEEMFLKREEEMMLELKELEQRVEMKETKIRAEIKTMKEAPQVLFCAYQNKWNSTGTVTFSQFISNFNNADQDGGGDGAMNLETGVFTSLTSGYYTLTLSGYSALDARVDNYLDLYQNGQMVWQLGYYWRQYHTGDLPATVGVMASRTLILHLGAGDTLELRSSGPGGRVYHLVFCLNLTARDYP